MRRRSLSILLFFVGLALVGSAAHSYFALPPGPALMAVKTDLDLGDRIVRRTERVIFQLPNVSGRPIRVLGLAPC
ncbi:MAG: hypothetical protein U0797_08835 [Gemmataceae bacterium]